MRAKDLMTKKIFYGYKETKIKDIIETMKEEDIGFVPIVNSELAVLGVITDRDIVIRCSSFEQTASDCMTYTFVGVFEEDDIKHVVKIMGEYQLRRIPVINSEEKLVGVIGIGNIALNKQTNPYLNDMLRELYLYNPQKDKPLRYLKVDDYRL